MDEFSFSDKCGLAILFILGGGFVLFWVTVVLSILFKGMV